MIRRLGFALVVVTALIVAACGRQVTPNPPGLGAGGALPGFMTIKFDVAGQFNFSSYQYWVIFNTSGNGKTPLTNPQQTNWAAFSSAVLTSGSAGGTSAGAGQFVKNSNPVIPPFFQILHPTPQLFQYIANSNGTGTEFSITFQRVIFNNQASPSPSPLPISPIWQFNAFVTQGVYPNQIFQDSMGAGGGTDTSFVSPELDVRQCFDQTFFKQQDINPPSDPSAQIVSIEIANNPSPGPDSSPCP